VPDILHYFALTPPPPAALRLARLQSRLRHRGLRGRPQPADTLHVSLKGFAEDDLDRAGEAAARVRRPPFVVAFNRLAVFGRGADERPLVLRGDEGVLGVDLLRSAVHRELAAVGLARPREGAFEAHLTLLRGRFADHEEPLAPLSWPVREFVLIRSFVGEARHEVVRRFALDATPALHVAEPGHLRHIRAKSALRPRAV
jgi:2'-5' RNA ligase